MVCQRKAVAILDAQIQAEKDKEKQKEAQANIKKGEESSGDTIQTTDTMEVDTIEPEAVVVKTEPQETQVLLGEIPLSEEPTSTDSTKVTFPLGIIPSGAAVPAGPRRAGSISLASLNRPNRPAYGLKLDLSATALRGLPSLDGSTVLDGTNVDAVTQMGAGTSFVDASMASPVTLAPKSAHPRAGDELFDLTQLDLIAAVQAQAEQDQMAMNEISELAAAAEIAGIVGDGTAENPLEIDLDLFGEGAGGGMDLGLDTTSGADNNGTGLASVVDVNSFFSAGPDKSDPLFSPAEAGVTGAPEIQKGNTGDPVTTADATTASDLFAALGIHPESGVQPPQKEDAATTSEIKEETKPTDPPLPAASSDTGLNPLNLDPPKALGVPETPGIQQPLATPGGLISTLPNNGAAPNEEQIREQYQQLALQRQQRFARAYNPSNLGTGSTPGLNMGINPNARNPQLTPGAAGAFTGMGMAAGGIGGPSMQVIAELRRQHLELARRQQNQQVLVPGQQQHHILQGGVLGTAGLGSGGFGGVGGSGDAGAATVGNFGMNFGIGGAGRTGSSSATSGSGTLGGFSSVDAFGSLDNLLGTGNAGGGFAIPGQFGQKNQQQ
jgi:hypothetical protein